jgi:hypothetical protein
MIVNQIDYYAAVNNNFLSTPFSNTAESQDLTVPLHDSV